MDFSNVIVGIIIIGLVIGGAYILATIIPLAYNEIKSYHIMEDECKINSDICFCNSGSCTIKSSCSFSKINDDPTIGGCNHTRLCEIFKHANWKEGLWNYDC